MHRGPGPGLYRFRRIVRPANLTRGPWFRPFPAVCVRCWHRFTRHWPDRVTDCEDCHGEGCVVPDRCRWPSP